jgi:hypothetical protein
MTTNNTPRPADATPAPFRAYKGQRWTIDRGDRKPSVDVFLAGLHHASSIARADEQQARAVAVVSVTVVDVDLPSVRGCHLLVSCQ